METKVVELLLEYYNRIEEIRKEIANKNGFKVGETQDARLVGLSGIQYAISGVFMSLHMRDMVLATMEQSPFTITKENKTEVCSKDNVIETTSDLLGHALILKTHFCLENMLRNILISLDKTTSKTIKFYNIISHPELKICFNEKHFSVLQILTNLRNTFHNNGIHRNRDGRFKVNGLQYDFMKDQAIHGEPGWNRELNLLDSIIVLLKEVLLSTDNRIANISGIIIDDYANT